MIRDRKMTKVVLLSGVNLTALASVTLERYLPNQLRFLEEEHCR
jgi:hypothetical protein